MRATRFVGARTNTFPAASTMPIAAGRGDDADHDRPRAAAARCRW